MLNSLETKQITAIMYASFKITEETLAISNLIKIDFNSFELDLNVE